MRVLVLTVRVLASLVYCVLGFIACIGALLTLWNLIAGGLPIAGILAHGNIPLLSVRSVLWAAAVLAPLIGCDIYFRVTKRYTR